MLRKTLKLVFATITTLVLVASGITSTGLASAAAEPSTSPRLATQQSVAQITIDNIVYTVDTKAPALGATVTDYTPPTHDDESPNTALIRASVAINGSNYPVTTIGIGTDARYTIVAADSGKTLTVTVTGTAPGFTAATTTSVIGSAVISGAFSSGSSPAILGDKIAGSTLTAVTFGWVPATGVTFSYVWSRGFTEETQSPISLATKSTYVLTDADKGQYISVRVTASKVGYTSVAKTSVVIQIDS